jgi:tetratricopeptide (TPR) repeat protein
MGTVYLAHVVTPHGGLEEGVPVALKVLHPHVGSQPRAVERMRREAELGSRVRHPNVVSFYGTNVLDDPGAERRYLAMEYVEGRNLRALLEALERVPEALLREIARQVADGLAAVHAAGAVHRDLKPSNVLITPDNTVRIMDLGMVRLEDESLAVTGEGEFSGSLRYAAPELFRGELAGPHSDIYGLGVMLHELATGKHPFPGPTPVDVITAHLSRMPPTLRSIEPSISPFLCAFVSRLLAKDPNERPQSAEEVRDILRDGERSAWWRGRSAADSPGDCVLPEVPVSRRASLQGRDGQMNQLRAAWARALVGRGGTVLLVGEAGIGKSRLVDALFREVEGTEVHALYGAYVSDGGPGGLTSGLRRIVRAAGGPVAGLERVLGEQARLAAPLAGALGFGDGKEHRAQLSGTALHGVLTRVVDGLARERPVLWVVEDAHDARPGSLELLLTLARATVGRRVLFVVTSRSDACEDAFLRLRRPAGAERIAVSRLGLQEVKALLHELSDDAAAVERLAPAVHERSAGVPLFAVALWDELVDRGWLDRGDGPLDDLPLPDAIRDVLHARLGALEEDERALLEVGAVQGYSFDPDLVAHVRDEHRLSVLRRLAEIEHRTTLIRPAGGAMRFDHREVRDVLLDEIGPEMHLSLHTALAAARHVLEGGGTAATMSGESCYFVARHHLLGERPTDALDFVMAALHHLRRSYRHEAAVDLCRLVLSLPDLLDASQLAKANLELAGHLSHLGRSDDQRAALDEALHHANEAGDTRAAATALSRIGDLLVSSGHPLDAVGMLEKALQMTNGASAQRRTHLRITLGSALHRLGRLEEARDQFRRALDNAIEATDAALEGLAAGALGNVSADLGSPKVAEKLQRRALKIARDMGDLEAECRAAGNLGITMIGLGRRSEALGLFERQHELALATGDRRVAGKCALNLANVHRLSGRVDDAIASYERAIRLYDDVGDRQGLGVVLGNYGQMRIMLGDVDGAREILERSLAVFDELGAERDRGYALVSLAVLERQHGDPDKARDLYTQSLASHERTYCAPGIAEAALGLGVLSAAKGDEAAAEQHFARSLDLSLERGLWDTAVLAALYDARRGGSTPRALELLAKHGEVLDASARAEAYYVAWEVSGDARHLRAAQMALDGLVDSVAPERREAVESRPLHRRIRSAVEDPDRSPPPRG